MKTAFCEKCNDFVGFHVVERKLSRNLKGREYTFSGKVALCDICNEEVWIPEIEDANLEALYDAYRDQHNIITLAKIKEIPEMFNIGKRPLSVLLGWGELTFTRYLNGSVPTLQYSDTLQRIYDDPKYYLSLLEENKDKIANITYEKSKDKTLELINAASSNKPKIEHVADYLLNQASDVTPLALQKGLYYAYGLNFAFNGTELFEDSCEAWKYGPVYRSVYSKYANYKYNPINRPKSINEKIFSQEEKDVLDKVASAFFDIGGPVLAIFTHNEDPWLEAREGLEPNEKTDNVISKDSIKDYFVKIKEENNMTSPLDIRRYALDKWNDYVKTLQR